MGMQVERQERRAAPVVRGVNLSGTLTDAEVAEIRKHWLEHAKSRSSTRTCRSRTSSFA